MWAAREPVAGGAEGKVGGERGGAEQEAEVTHSGGRVPARRDSWGRGRWAAVGGKPATSGTGREPGPRQGWKRGISAALGECLRQHWEARAEEGGAPEVMQGWGFAALSLAAERSRGSRVRVRLGSTGSIPQKDINPDRI